jgi:DNA-directed RNA polymerase specialized sigma24 family protein
MTNANSADKLDAAFLRAGFGNPEAFAEWMGMVEYPLRRSLARFARAVDVEVVVQETFMRMWLVAAERTKILEGEHASLKFVLAVGRNVALEEVRRGRLDRFVDLEKLDQLPEGSLNPELPDPALRKAIAECIDRLPRQPRKALKARIQEGHLPDRDLAQEARMKLNTFLQNIVRARKLLADCLERRGVRLGELLT